MEIGIKVNNSRDGRGEKLQISNFYSSTPFSRSIRSHSSSMSWAKADW